jgi:hypothetical protein
MSIVEVQIATEKFCQYLTDRINRTPLPAPESIANTPLGGVILERITCTGCSVRPSNATGQLVIDVTVEVHYHSTLNDIHLAGSLTPPQATVSPPTATTITLTCTTDGRDVNLTWQADAYSIAETITFPAPTDSPIAAAAIDAGAEVVAIRLGTRDTDPVRSVPVNRLGGTDWTIHVSSGVFVESLIQRLNASLYAAQRSDVEVTRAARGNWDMFTQGHATAWGEISKINGCVFANIPIELMLDGHFVMAGSQLTTTVVLSWEPDTTWCDIVAGLSFATLAGYVLGPLTAGATGVVPATSVGVGFVADPVVENAANKRVKDQAREQQQPEFTQTASDDVSITLERVQQIPLPDRNFVLTHSEFNFFGLTLSGHLERSPAITLEGSVRQPFWSSEISCRPTHVEVQWNPPTTTLTAVNADQPPKLFAQLTVMTPSQAWSMTQYDTLNDLVITFGDPPGGRLPGGQQTSVVLCTDRGVRWVDLGIIPADAIDRQQLQSDAEDFCSSVAKVLRRAADRLTHVDWKVDPLHDPDPDLVNGIAPLRLWQFGILDRPDVNLLDFYVMGPQGTEKRIGTLDDTAAAALSIVTRADEVVAIRAQREMRIPALRLTQAWIKPLTDEHLHGQEVAAFSPLHSSFTLTQGGRITGIARLKGREISAAAVPPIAGARSTPAAVSRVTRSQTSTPSWAQTYRIDRRTIAVVHEGKLVVGTIEAQHRIT